MPLPPEAFSQFATTKSAPSRAISRGRTARTARRPGRPTTSPRKTSLMSSREVARPRLADHGDLDLSGIRHLLLDLARDVPGEQRGLVVRHRSRVDDDPDLAAGLYGERPLDTAERVADPLEILEPLDVALEHFAARARPRTRESVRRVDERRQDRLRPDLLVVGGDRIYDLRRLAVLPRNLAADDGVGALHL